MGDGVQADRHADSPSDWFPPERGPVLVIGNPGSLFPRHLASLWRSLGLDARIITGHWQGDRVLPDGTPVIAADDFMSRARRWSHRLAQGLIRRVEAPLVLLQQERYQHAMGSETSYRPLVSDWVEDALAISRVVRAMRPQFVCGQEVFAYGLATAFSRPVPRMLMPWGGDVYMYCNTTSLAFAAVQYALTHVDLVVPGSTLARDYLARRFGVSLKHMHCGGLWTLDRNRFRRASLTERVRICDRFGIDRTAPVIMNVRRFFPAWGSDLALRAFVRFAKEHPSSHFVLLGGTGTESFVAGAREVVRQEGLSQRFTLFDGDVSLDDCAALMSISDIFVSLMRETDMRPLASILEAAASGAAPVLGDQPEYRAMASLGFQARFCPIGDDAAVVSALRSFAADQGARMEASRQNLAYLDQHEVGQTQAVGLLRRVRTLLHASGEITTSRGTA
jgi:glycosyltransferase involved in cell wall biosynthesis